MVSVEALSVVDADVDVDVGVDATESCREGGVTAAVLLSQVNAGAQSWIDEIMLSTSSVALAMSSTLSMCVDCTVGSSNVKK